MSALAIYPLTGTVAAAISDEEVLKPNKLAWVTQHFLIIRNAERKAHTIIPLFRLSGIEVIKTPYAGLLAIAAGVFIIAAACLASKQGDGAALPCALLGAFLIAGYFGSRRAFIKFKIDTGAIESAVGTTGEASALIQLIAEARRSAIGGDEDAPEFSILSRNAPPSAKRQKSARPALA